MYRNKPVKGFVSPLVAQPSTHIEKVNDATDQREASPNETIKKTVRSRSQILSLFEKAIRGKVVASNDDEVENVAPKKRDAVDAFDEKKTLADNASDMKIIFNVVYGKVSSKKHKTWDGDGLLEVTGKTSILKDLDGNVMGRTTKVDPNNAVEGLRLIIGNKEIEIIDRAPQQLCVPEKHPEEKIDEPLQKKFKAHATRAYVPLLPSTKGFISS